MCSELTRHKIGSQWRNFYGRFKGKALSAKQSEILRDEFAKYSIKNISWEDNPLRKSLNLTEIFSKNKIWLEIGFGGGEHLMHQAKLNPDIGIIGCEPYINGLAMLLRKLSDQPFNNVRLYDGDARNIFDVLPKSSIEKVFFISRSWPKKAPP